MNSHGTRLNRSLCPFLTIFEIFDLSTSYMRSFFFRVIEFSAMNSDLPIEFLVKLIRINSDGTERNPNIITKTIMNWKKFDDSTLGAIIVMTKMCPIIIINGKKEFRINLFRLNLYVREIVVKDFF